MEPFELIETISIASVTDSDVPSEASIANDWSEVEEISDVRSVQVERTHLLKVEV